VRCELGELAPAVAQRRLRAMEPACVDAAAPCLTVEVSGCDLRPDRRDLVLQLGHARLAGGAGRRQGAVADAGALAYRHLAHGHFS
jgi:hypothetical protein